MTIFFIIDPDLFELFKNVMASCFRLSVYNVQVHNKQIHVNKNTHETISVLITCSHAHWYGGAFIIS